MIVTITNQKGGCGKTSTALALASGLVMKGHSVLVIDADPQTNLTYSSDVESPECTLYDVMKGTKTASECIVSTSVGYSLLPGGIRLTALEGGIKSDILRNALQPIRDQYEYIVIDTPPTLGALTVNSLMASDCVIVPMKAEIFSLQGLTQLSGMIDNVKKYNPNLYVDGLLLTQYRPQTNLSKILRVQVNETAKQFGTRLYKASIREASAVAECQLLKTDLYSEYPKANVTKDYEAFVDEFLKGRK